MLGRELRVEQHKPACAEALDGFEGAIVVISHDRYFLDRVVDRVAVLKDGDLLQYAGGYTDYHEDPMPLSGSRS